MVDNATLTKVARIADEDTGNTRSYHDGILAVADDLGNALADARTLIRQGTIDADDARSRDRGQGNPADTMRTLATAEFTRYASPELLQDLAEQGKNTLTGVDRGHQLLKRGRINFSDLNQAGIPLKNGSVYKLPTDTMETLADASFCSEVSVQYRSQFTLPESVQTALGKSRKEREFSEVAASQKPRYFQSAYELSTALTILKEQAPATFSSLISSSETLSRIREDRLQPYLTGVSHEFQEHFIVSQKDMAWAWRNQLEDGKSQRQAPELSTRDILFRNQMGLGMLEYLLPAGKATLEYLRHFGQQLQNAPYRRTEIRDEHMHELLTGVPLTERKQLIASPDVLVHLAREHHELWRFSREISWCLDDASLHQPPRTEAHLPWQDLPVSTKNRDILNIFGVAYMLGSFSENDFNELARAAAPGNPNRFHFIPVETI